MTLPYIIAAIHISTLALGFAGLLLRSRALKNLQTTKEIKEVFFADNLYGIAALLWVGTGFWRAFGGLEKGADYYLSSTAFLIKLSVFGIIFLLELYPMISLIKWRITQKRGETIDFTIAPTLHKLCQAQLVLLVVIVFLATAMARGMWY